MKKVTSLSFVLLALLFAATGCSGISPKETAEMIVKAQIENHIDTIYGMLCKADQEVINQQEFVKRYKRVPEIAQIINLIPEAEKDIKADKFKQTIIGDNTAVVTYVLSLPDNDKIGQSVLNLNDLQNMLGSKINSLSDLPEEIKAKIKDYVKEHGVPTKKVAMQMNLVKENDVWKLNLNLGQRIPAKNFPMIFEPAPVQ